MKTIEATYRIVTPMFIGGADGNPTDGIRPPSFKGALRFWWRALNWGRCFQQENEHEANALKALHKEEERLFGTSARVENGKISGGQGSFLLTIQQGNLKTTRVGMRHEEFKKNAAARYLGYGLMGAFGEKAGELERGCISHNQTFTVQLRFRKEVIPSIIDAVKAVGLLGGLGSRSRKGIGSIAIESLKVENGTTWSKPNTTAEYQHEIKRIFEDVTFDSKHPPFSAFSGKTRIDCLLEASGAMTALNQYGKSMMMYRSWGNNGKVLGQPREKNFKDDHDWSKGMMPKEFHPKRVVFGLPHNYGKYENLHVEPAKHKRRSSPLMFHVHQIGETFIGISILMPADFLPTGEKIKAGKVNVDAKIEWEVLENFILGKDKEGSLRFPSRTAVLIGGKT